MCFYNVVSFTICSNRLLPQNGQICMSQAIMLLIDVTFRNENVVMHIMCMAFLSKVESYKFMPG